MFQPVIDASAVARANSLPLEGLTQSIQHYDQLNEVRRKERIALAKQARSEQWKGIQGIANAYNNVDLATGAPVDPLIHADAAQKKQMLVQAILKGADPEMVVAQAVQYAGDAKAKSSQAKLGRELIEKRTAADVAANPLVDATALLNHRLNAVFRNPDGTANINFDPNQDVSLDFNNPAAIAPFVNQSYVEKQMPTVMQGMFPPQQQVLYTDPTTGRPFTDAYGTPVAKKVSMAGDQTYNPSAPSGQRFGTKYDPYNVQGTVNTPVYTPEQAQAIGDSRYTTSPQPQGSMQSQGSLGTLPIYPEDLTHTLLGSGIGYHAVHGEITKVTREFEQKYGKKRAKEILDAIGDDALTRYAAYRVADRHAPKNGNKEEDDYTPVKTKQQFANDALRNNIAIQANERANEANQLSKAKFQHELSNDENALSGTSLNTGEIGKDGKPIAKHLTNKELKETKAALMSVPGMWLNVMGGSGPEAQAEALTHLPAPITFGGAKWTPLTPSSNGKGEYLTDPNTQAPVQIYYDPIYTDPKTGKAGRIAIVPMVKEKGSETYSPDSPTKAKYFTGAALADFMHTYGPQAIKGGGVSYDRLAPFVNHAFGQ